MPVSTISSLAPTTLNGQQIDKTIRAPKKVLDQGDFLKLLAVQFSTQDPMKPMEDTAFIAQMAQFSSLEQASQTRKDQQMQTSTAYLGRNVTVKYLDELGKNSLLTGVVSAVDNSGASPELVINGRNFPLSAVKKIETSSAATPGPAGDPAPTTTTPTSVRTSDQFPQLYNLIRDRVIQGI